jgi:hypothetical protein
VSRQPTPAQIREFIRAHVQDITGQRLASRRIRLFSNPRADSRIAFNLATRKIYWIGIATVYWRGSLEVLRAVVTHEVMNTYIKYSITDSELLEAKEIVAAGDDAQKRIAVRTLFEVTLGGWKRIRDRKLQVDRLCLEWYHAHGWDPVPYIYFLVEEWYATQEFSEPRRTYHGLICAKRIESAKRFLQNSFANVL